jgi:hypothetical protein
MDKKEALREAYERGLLPPDMKAAYEEAQRRGLLEGVSVAEPRQVTRMIGGKDPMPYTFDIPQSEAELKGVDVTTGAPVGRFAASYAQNEAQAAENYRQKLSEYYGQPVDVIKTEFGLEFIDPETNQRTLIDEEQATLRDVLDMARPTLTAVGAVAGAVGAPLLTRGAVSPDVGAAGGAGLAEVINRTIGHALGVRDQDIGEEAKGVVGISLAEYLFGKAGAYSMKAAQKIRNYFRPRVLSADDAARINIAIQNDQEVAEEIARRTGVDYQPFTGQLANDPILLGHQTSLKVDPETAVNFRRQEVQSETALESFFDLLNPPPATPSISTTAGRSIKLEARDQIQPRVDRARDSVNQALDDLETITRELPRGENATIVNEATAAAAAARKVVKDEEDLLWEGYKKAIGLNPDTALSDITVPVDGSLRRQLSRLAASAEQAIDPEDAAAMWRLLPESLTKDGVDLWQLQRYIGSLKRRLRLQNRNKVATDPTGHDIRNQITAAQKQRDKFLRENYPELADDILEAEALTEMRATTFDEGLVAQLLRKEGGEWVITDKHLVGAVIGTGDREAMEHLVSALGNHPAGIPTLQRGFLRYYRNEVVEDGIPNGRLHRRFMENHRDAIDVLFPGDRSLQRLGEFEAVVTARIKRFEQFEKNVTKTFRGKIQNISPEHVVDRVFTTFTNKEVSQLMRLAEAAGVDNLYKDAIRKEIRRNYFSRFSGISVKPLEKFLAKNETKLISTLGGRYVRDMDLLLDGLKTIRTSETRISTTRRPGLLATISEGLARSTVARPLSPHGVALTRTIGFHQRAKQRMWARIIEDPKMLRAIIVNKNADIHSQNGARILTLIGGTYLYGDIVSIADYTDEVLREANQ